MAPAEITRPHRDVAGGLIGTTESSSEIPVRLAVEIPDTDDNMVGATATGLGVAFGLLGRAVASDVDVVPLRRPTTVVRVDGLVA